MLLHNRLLRAKYYHGYGVHSPFVYMLVRNAFMGKGLESQDDHSLYEALLRRDVAERRAVQLQRTFAYCKASSFAIDEAAGDFRVLTEAFPTESLSKAYEEAHKEGVVLVIMKPYADRCRQRVCCEIVERHDSTSVDNRAYLIIFNTSKLPKQNFRL